MAETRKMWILMIMAMIMLSVIPSARAEVFVSVDCPKQVYLNEIFTCTVRLYNDSTVNRVISYHIRFDKDHAQVLSANAEGEVNVPALQKEELDFNVWTVKTGSEAFIFEYGASRVDSLAAKIFAISASPLQLDLDKITITAGQRNTVRAALEGSGTLVSISVDYPPGMLGTKNLEVGDVDGEYPISIDISPDPYIVGTRSIDFYIRFTDDRGEHVLLKRVVANISPSMNVIAAVIGGAALLLLVAYLLRRRQKSGA